MKSSSAGERQPDCTMIAIIGGVDYKRYEYEKDLADGRFEKNAKLFFVDLALGFSEAAAKRGRLDHFQQLQNDYHGRH
jgi:hypothetical protein